MEGWIKLHRQFLSWEWFDDAIMVKLFLFLLLSANHKEQKWKGHTIKRGQLITGLSSLNSSTGISTRTLRTCLSKLEKTGEIDRQSDNRFTVITICNYDSYQHRDEQSDKQNDKQPTSNRQATDNKQEEKELKNEKNTFLERVYFEKSKELNDAFRDYLRLRIKSKFTMTDRAISALVNRLRSMSGGNVKEAIRIVDSAIVGKWKSFYNGDK